MPGITDLRPPGPPPRPAGLLGRASYGLRFLLDPIGFVGGRFTRYGDTYFVPSPDGGPGLFVFRHPDHLRDVFITEARKMGKQHTGFQQLREVLGNGLLTAEDEAWRRQRRLIQPAFTRQRIAGYSKVMCEEARGTAASHRDGAELDVASEMMELTLRVVSRTLLGYTADSNEAKKAQRGMAAIQTSAVSLSMLLPKKLSLAQRRVGQATAALDQIIYGLIEARRQRGRVRGENVDLLQMLIDARDDGGDGDGGGLSDREIRDQLMTFYFAGHETTSNALTWAFYLLSQNPEARARLEAEVDLLDGPPSIDDLPRLTYADWVVTEAMRLFPPIPVLIRSVHEDAKIGPWHVPAGSEVAAWVYYTHHDSRWFEEPWAFRPERWDPSCAEERPRLAYLPYGAGARACIGKVFAQTEAVLILATLAQRLRYDLVPGHPVEAHPRVTLTPKHGMKMNVRRRRTTT